jgi:hypothetical protein
MLKKYFILKFQAMIDFVSCWRIYLESIDSQGWLKGYLVRKEVLKLGALQPIGYSTSDFSGPAVTKSRNIV